MIRRISSSRASSLTRTNVSKLRAMMRVGDIFPAKIVEGLGEGRYIVQIKGQQVLAESHLNLENKRHFIQVQALHPKINLRLVSLQDGESMEFMVHSASRWGIPLNIFNQYVLDRLYRKDPKRKKDPTKLLSFLLQLTALRQGDDLIEFDDWIEAFNEMSDQDIQIVLNLLKQTRSSESKPRSSDEPQTLSEDFIYLFKQIGSMPDQQETTPETSGYQEALVCLNRALKVKDKHLYFWNFPSGKVFEAVLIEKALHSENHSIVFQMNYRSKMLDRIRIRLYSINDTKAISLGFTNSIIAGELTKHLSAIKQSLPGITSVRTEILSVSIPGYLEDSGSFYL